MTKKPVLRFRIILHQVEPNWTSRVQGELARLFQVDDGVASSIVNAVPIAIFDDLGVDTAVRIREQMQSLVDAGCQFVMTDERTDEIPKINWPELPEFARESVESSKNKLAPPATPPPTQPPPPQRHKITSC
jgi:hypothetical protein